MNNLTEFQLVELTKVLVSASDHLVELKKTEMRSVLLVLQTCQLSIYWLLNHFGLVSDDSLADFITYFNQSYAKEYLDIIGEPHYRADKMFSQLDPAQFRVTEYLQQSLLHRMWLDIWQQRIQQAPASVEWLESLQAELPKPQNSKQSLTNLLQQVGIQRHVWRQLNQLHQRGLYCPLSLRKPMWLSLVLANTPARCWPQNAFGWINWFYLQTQTEQKYPEDPDSAAAVSLLYQPDEGWNGVQSLLQQNLSLLRVLLPELDDKTRRQIICQYWGKCRSRKYLALITVLTCQPHGNTVLPLRITNAEPTLAIRLLTIASQYQQQGIQWVNCLDSLQTKAALGLCAVFIVDIATETYLAEVEPAGIDQLRLVQLRDIANKPATADAFYQVQQWLAQQQYSRHPAPEPQLQARCRAELLNWLSRRKIYVPALLGQNFPSNVVIRADKNVMETDT
ncbi:hypothetical protein [Rheinheimera sp. F8]|uniref:hypothetical protein n=1 Tax=Rheinheimera sp. F8 TaxID=1763998 RepID=UPI001AD84A74|nr:hypothetical protein [Rheinheimera sp. F8]